MVHHACERLNNPYSIQDRDTLRRSEHLPDIPPPAAAGAAAPISLYPERLPDGRRAF
jgi:hypothetical protein